MATNCAGRARGGRANRMQRDRRYDEREEVEVTPRLRDCLSASREVKAWLCPIALLLPSPNRTIVGIDHFPDVAEAAFCQHSS